MNGSSRAADPATLKQFFGDAEGLLPLWLAEPSVEVAAPVREAMVARAEQGWFGYEVRPERVREAFWSWMERRHGWSGGGLPTAISPSVGTSIALLLEQHTERGDGVILQPPVYTGFKPLVAHAKRRVVKNPLTLTDTGYRMDLEDLAAKAADPRNRALILCNPHNPVGRQWTPEELRELVTICAAHDVFLISDEIHADLVLGQAPFTPLATAARHTDLRWAATHGPIKSFGLAGLCDTLTVCSDAEVHGTFQMRCKVLHLNRNHGFGVPAFEMAYRHGDAWLDQLLDTVRANLSLLRTRLPEPIRLLAPEATYLAWLDLRELGLGVPELADWLASRARLALSPGHWFGREGAGFARLTVAVPTSTVAEAIDRLHKALALL